MVKSNQRGFTMIELVVVIVILGILAAFALPKYMGLENQARVAAVNGMTGSIRSAANMAHGVWMASGNPATITVEGTAITITNGYPNALGLSQLIQDSSGFTVAPNPPVAGSANVKYTPNGARTPANCYVQYAPPAAASGPIVITMPTAAQLQAGC
jgi:MSHA pilin protein MshA